MKSWRGQARPPRATVSVSLDPSWGTSSACAGQRWANASAPAHLATSGIATASCGLSPWPPAGAFSSSSVLSRPRSRSSITQRPWSPGFEDSAGSWKVISKSRCVATLTAANYRTQISRTLSLPRPNNSPPPAPARRPEPCSAESHPQTHLLSLQRPNAMVRKPQSKVRAQSRPSPGLERIGLLGIGLPPGSSKKYSRFPARASPPRCPSVPGGAAPFPRTCGGPGLALALLAGI